MKQINSEIVPNFNTNVYRNSPRIALGFHGCDYEIAYRILTDGVEHLSPSTNNYDWLGDGIYFWENDPIRAYEWALQSQKRNPDKIKQACVLGAVIDLGMCLNLSERGAIELLQRSYSQLKHSFQKSGYNINDLLKNKYPDDGGFHLVRPLDCAVIRNLHSLMQPIGIEFDTVCGYFQEGADAFEGAGIKEKSHIQICVRNTDCIKGYFLPRKYDHMYITDV